MEEFTFDENYGDLRKDTMALVRKHNVSPSDMMMIQLSLSEDWDRINTFIRANLNGKSFNYPFGGTP